MSRLWRLGIGRILWLWVRNYFEIVVSFGVEIVLDAGLFEWGLTYTFIYIRLPTRKLGSFFFFFLFDSSPSFFGFWYLAGWTIFVIRNSLWYVGAIQCEAHMFTAGSIGDLVLTVAFIPILCNFPRFIRKVKAEGVDSSVIIRLRKFFELNVSFVLLGFF